MVWILIIYLEEGGGAGVQSGEKEVSKYKICEAQVKFTVSYKKSVVQN